MDRVAGRQVGVSVVPALVIVELDVELLQLREVDAQRAAAVVDVLTVQRLSTHTHTHTHTLTAPPGPQTSQYDSQVNYRRSRAAHANRSAHKICELLAGRPPHIAGLLSPLDRA